MARQSVVVEPGPGPRPRRTEVLRPGPPAGRGRLLDAALGAAGALLLVLAGSLVAVLPERDVVLPQFRATANDILGEEVSRGGEVTQQEGTQEFDYEVAADNVHAILVVLTFTDDVRASLTDTLKVELFAPDGTPVGGERNLASARPGPPSEEGGPLTYNATLNSGRFLFSVATKPEEEIVTGVEEHETAEEARQRLSAEAFQPTNGTWRLRVTLVSAGDCPPPQDPDQARVASCLLEVQGRQGEDQDRGNSFTIEKFEYTSYSLAVEELV